MDKVNMQFVGFYDDFHVYRNSDGFLEGFKKVGKNMSTGYKDCKRVVSNQVTPEGFLSYVKGLKPRKKVKDIELKPSQLPSLFSDEHTTD